MGAELGAGGTKRKRGKEFLIVNRTTMEINELTGLVVDLCIKIHKRIGPGCFEKVYEEILCHELQRLNIRFHRQLFLPIDYGELHIDRAYKLDVLVENMLILELKSVCPLSPLL